MYVKFLFDAFVMYLVLSSIYNNKRDIQVDLQWNMLWVGTNLSYSAHPSSYSSCITPNGGQVYLFMNTWLAVVAVVVIVVYIAVIGYLSFLLSRITKSVVSKEQSFISASPCWMGLACDSTFLEHFFHLLARLSSLVFLRTTSVPHVCVLLRSSINSHLIAIHSPFSPPKWKQWNARVLSA